MMIANSDNENHTFRFIPKGTDVFSVIITNILTGDTYSFTKSKIFKEKYYYVLLNASITVTNNDNFTFQVFDKNDNLVFNDIVFCTNQPVSDYTINKDIYTEKVTQNKFILNEQ